MKKENEDQVKTLSEGVIGLLTLILLPITFFLDAFVVRELWKWYVVPTFHLPALTLPVAFGLWCVGFALVGQSSPLKPEYCKDPFKQLTDSILTRVVVYGLGALGTVWL